MRGMFMKSILLKLKKKMKRNIYKRELFPYDMGAMRTYARERNVPIHTLSSNEIAMFLLKKPIR